MDNNKAEGRLVCINSAIFKRLPLYLFHHKVWCNTIVKGESVEKKKYLTTGQFAKLCATTKDTLFHYDREGILKPKLVSPNGYRRYRAEQFFEFDLICVLREAGSSIEDIRGYLSNYGVDHLLPFLDQKIADVTLQRKKLDQRLATLQHISELTRSALAEQYGTIKIVKMKAERLLVEEINRSNEHELSWDESAYYLSRHLNRCRQAGVNLFPVGSIVPKDNLLNGSFNESHFFSRLDEEMENERILKKPAGNYADFRHQGSFDSLREAFPGYLAQIKGLGLEIRGDAYIYMLLSYLTYDNEDNDVFQIMIKVSAPKIHHRK